MVNHTRVGPSISSMCILHIPAPLPYGMVRFLELPLVELVEEAAALILVLALPPLQGGSGCMGHTMLFLYQNKTKTSIILQDPVPVPRIVEFSANYENEAQKWSKLKMLDLLKGV